MRKIIFSIVLLGTVAFLVFGGIKAVDIFKEKFPLFLMENTLLKDDEQEVIAVYDPDGMIPKNIEHYRLKLKADSEWQLETNELKSVPKDQSVLLTIEIWGSRVLDSISEGKFDEEISEILKPLKKRENILIRFNPEMEVADSETSWANWGAFHVRAFQQFSKVTKRTLPKAKLVWGPAGTLGNMEYYPGKESFQVASISLDKKDKNDLFLKEKDPLEVLERKLYRMRFLNTPLLVLNTKTSSEHKEKNMFAAAFSKYEKAKKTTNLEDLEAAQMMRNGNSPKIGVYDPHKSLIKNEAISLEHIFIGFKNIRNGTYEKDLAQILSRGHDVIITVEPDNIEDSLKGTNVLKQIISGKYDPLLKRFYEVIPPEYPTLYIRFAHEMEIPVDRYDWQKQDPLLYIEAFRYFMQFPGDTKSNIKKVWAPAGDRGSVEWWPGGDVVDYISMSVYGLPDKNITDFKLQDSFKVIYNRKKRRLDLFGKPFLIAEFGVKGNDEYQERWMLEAAKIIHEHKEIFGVSYFNYHDAPKAWGDIQPPDWQISEEVFETFTRTLLQQP